MPKDKVKELEETIRELEQKLEAAEKEVQFLRAREIALENTLNDEIGYSHFLDGMR